MEKEEMKKALESISNIIVSNAKDSAGKIIKILEKLKLVEKVELQDLGSFWVRR